jgi:hypothetical protein
MTSNDQHGEASSHRPITYASVIYKGNPVIAFHASLRYARRR